MTGEIFHRQFVGMFVKDSVSVYNLASYGIRFFASTFVFISVSILIGIYFQSETKPTQALIVLLGRSAVFPIIMLFLLNIFLGKMSELEVVLSLSFSLLQSIRNIYQADV